MEQQIKSIYKEIILLEETLGVLLINKKDILSPVTDGFDFVLLVARSNLSKPLQIDHYHYQGKKLQVIYCIEAELTQWLVDGLNRKVIEWIHFGEVIFEKGNFFTNYKETVVSFPYELRSKKVCIEFGRLIRSYQEGKELFRSNNILDAYNQILKALHHWARLSVIEKGYHPEVTVWNQVKKIDPEIHKLYEELVMGSEKIDQRIELLLLASEFSLMSKTEIGAAHLLEVFKMKEGTWLYSDLYNHPAVKEYSYDLSILLEHLVKKSLVNEISIKSDNLHVEIRAYVLNEEKL